MKSITSRTILVCLTAMLLAVSCGAGSSAIDETTTQTQTPPSTPLDTATPAAPTSASPEPVPTESASPEAASTETATAESSEAEPTPVEIPKIDFPTGIKPVRISIPSIGVDAPTIDLSLAGLEPEVPTDFDDTGWYAQTRLPGEIGPAVIAGHIDSRSGPAVFALLDQLQPGAEITVYDDEGESRTFIVTAGEQHPKGDLPPGVFGFNLPEPELRLITCGGTFDAESGHYRDNYIVYAVAA